MGIKDFYIILIYQYCPIKPIHLFCTISFSFKEWKKHLNFIGVKSDKLIKIYNLSPICKQNYRYLMMYSFIFNATFLCQGCMHPRSKGITHKARWFTNMDIFFFSLKKKKKNQFKMSDVEFRLM